MSSANTSEPILTEFLRKYSVNRSPMSDLEFRWWSFKGRVRHLLGTHTMIASEVWSRDADGKLIIQATGWRCWFCEYRERP